MFLSVAELLHHLSMSHGYLSGLKQAITYQYSLLVVPWSSFCRYFFHPEVQRVGYGHDRGHPSHTMGTFYFMAECQATIIVHTSSKIIFQPRSMTWWCAGGTTRTTRRRTTNRDGDHGAAKHSNVCLVMEFGWMKGFFCAFQVFVS